MKRGVVGLIALAAVLAAAQAAAARPSGSTVVPATSRVLGRSYTQWMVESWQWALAHAHSYVGTNTRSLTCLTGAQPRGLWFLEDEYEGDAPVTVTCQVPAGRYVFLEGPAFDCSTVEAPPFLASVRNLAACARRFVLAGARITLDGRLLTPSAVPVATGAFPFVMPPVANVLKVPGQTHGFAAVHADALILRPLRRGPHTIVQVERFTNGTAVETTWRITVR